MSDNDSRRLGNCRVWVGNDTAPFSTSLTLATTDPISEGGFINLDKPLTGQYVVLRRVGASIDGSFTDLLLCELKVYSVTNLLGYGATILKASAPSNSLYGAENLVNNLRQRSSRHSENPIIVPTTRATHNSCFVATHTQIGPDGDKFELVFDLGKSMMVNAVIIAQDHFNGFSDEHTN